MFDILIRNGLLFDGSGSAPRKADVLIDDGVIVAVDRAIDAEADRFIDADGQIVTPGFIDVHTHYDGQATWDSAMLPSSAHGVTTVVMGNCGIGFAPVRPGGEARLITLMEGVEDIPGSVLHEGMSWNWESFPDYLDQLATCTYALDIAAHVPHSAVRAYVMGERAADDSPATDSDLEQIGSIVSEAIRAGAVGVGTSRIAMHQGSDGSPLPGNDAEERELLVIAEAMRDAGGGVFQLVPSGSGGNVGAAGDNENLAALGTRRDRWALGEEIAMVRRLSARTGLPMTFSFAQNRGLGEAAFQSAIAQAQECARDGETVHPQVSARPTGILSTLDGYHAFLRRPSYMAIANLPVAERARRMGDPAVKAAILSEDDVPPVSADPMSGFHLALQRTLSEAYPMGEFPDYEPDPEGSVAREAERQGRPPLDLLYDLLITDDGCAVVMVFASNYSNGDLALTEALLRNDQFVFGLGDAGAHVRAICDASIPTFMLTHWARDRRRGPTVPVELLVRRMTSDPARLYGFKDRGLVRPGLRADLNVIDLDRLRLRRPYLVRDLPAQGERFMQDASGYSATIVAGVVTRKQDRDTGARPGRLLRRPN